MWIMRCYDFDVLFKASVLESNPNSILNLKDLSTRGPNIEINVPPLQKLAFNFLFLFSSGAEVESKI